ncbi:Trub2p [Halocaridina rubra]|uniref:Trub2p n=1 Tax=Halocaridina rubra TaxID=373956 RepID=A0AAN8X022_HALRR
MHKNISGVCVMGVNKGTSGTHTVREGRLVRTYSLGGCFGFATDTAFHDGKVLTKATYRHITKSKLARLLMMIQASHQQSAVHFLGLDLQSQAAYEAISEEGMVRPGEKSPPLIYSLNILDFNPPNFTLEVSCINENNYFFQDLIHKIGLQLKSNAVCTHMRCIRYGPWTLQHALLRKHWTLEHIINNINISWPLIRGIKPESPSLRDIDTDKYSEDVAEG